MARIQWARSRHRNELAEIAGWRVGIQDLREHFGDGDKYGTANHLAPKFQDSLANPTAIYSLPHGHAVIPNIAAELQKQLT